MGGGLFKGGSGIYSRVAFYQVNTVYTSDKRKKE